MLVPQIKNNKEVEAYLFSSPLRQFKLFVPGITDSDLDLIIEIFNNKNVYKNFFKFLNKLKKVSKK